MSLTALALCSRALLRLGAQPIASLTEGTPEAEVAANLYPGIRDALLSAHPWSFASAAPVAGFCSFGYPGAPEGPVFADSLILQDVGAPAAPAPKYLRTGEWYHLRLQVFPDGRCAIALNGTPVLIGSSVVTSQPTYLFLYGMSVQSRILVGPLTVFSGVRTDVEWDSRRR